MEEVLNKRKMEGTLYYLVKWTGWPSKYNLYEPALYLENTPNAVHAYERKQKRKAHREDDDEALRPAKRKKNSLDGT